MDFYLKPVYEKNSDKPYEWILFPMGEIRNPLAVIQSFNMEKMILRYLNEIGPEATKTLVKLVDFDN